MADNKYYKTWWTGSSTSNKTAGVGIAIKLGLHNHVVKVLSLMGRLILVDLKFKGKSTLRIIVTYIHSNEQDAKDRKKLIDEIKRLIKEANNKKYNVILLGDLNADFEKLESNHKNFKKDKYRILTTIERLGLYDSQKITNTELEPTWIKNENTERRIDYIWINEYLVNSLVKTRVITDDTLYSDHRLLNMTRDGVN